MKYLKKIILLLALLIIIYLFSIFCLRKHYQYKSKKFYNSYHHFMPNNRINLKNIWLQWKIYCDENNNYMPNNLDIVKNLYKNYNLEFFKKEKIDVKQQIDKTFSFRYRNNFIGPWNYVGIKTHAQLQDETVFKLIESPVYEHKGQKYKLILYSNGTVKHEVANE